MDDKKPLLSGPTTRRGALLMGAALAAAAPGAQALQPVPGLSVEDRTTIQDLFTTYLWAFDCGDENGFLDLFTPDGMIVGLGKAYVGHEAMGDWFRRLIAMRDTAEDAWLHEAGQFRFDGDGHRCIVYAYATHFRMHLPSRDLGVRSLGYYVNECVRTDGVWRFRRFSINRWDNNLQPWRKPMPWDEAAPEIPG